MAIVGWNEVVERARLGDISAINALVETIAGIGQTDDAVDLANAEWEVDAEPKTAGEIAGDHLRQLRDQAVAAEAENEELKTKLRQSASDYHSLTESITERLKEAVVAGDLEMDAAKTIAVDLGAPEPEWKWSVEVDVKITISGAEGNEEDLEQKVRDALSLDVDTSELGSDADETVEITGVEITSED